MVEYDEVDSGIGKSIKKSSKSRRIVKKSENLKGLKSCKGHRFGGTFTEVLVLCQLDTKNLSFR